MRSISKLLRFNIVSHCFLFFRKTWWIYKNKICKRIKRKKNKERIFSKNQATSERIQCNYTATSYYTHLSLLV